MEFSTISSRNITSNSSIIKPNYHLNYGKLRIEKSKKNNHKFSTLGELTSEVYTGGIFKRVFIDNSKYGLPYISAQHMMNTNPLVTAKIISKKYTPRQNDMTLRDKQILVSCAGTIGNVKLINNELDGVIGSQDIIRVIADDNKAPYGFIYAYLSTSTAYNYMQSFIYGSVVPRIDPSTLKKLPVPLLQDSLQKNIHKLIVESSKLRIQANLALEKAQNIFTSKIKTNIDPIKIGKVRYQRIKQESRIGGNFFLSKGDLYEKAILDGEFKYLSSYVADIFTGGRDKRKYTKKEYGVAFLSNGNISSFNPFNSCNYMVRKNVKEKSLIKKNMILSGRVGQDTVGKVYLPYDLIENTIASDNIIRIEISNENDINIIFAFLSSKVGNEIIRKRKTGVGQPFVNEEMFTNIPIPLVNESDKIIIDKNINFYQKNINLSLQLELNAIDMIEKEIDKWQK